ncbi:MAG: hypothetical protein F6K09_30610 [Merismopedia sp. SIO2A8]|nr:hypothetical protein [Symploca sp. SIO2B6]NET52866.1 hypothetical protein [Merismopedia sp. SIO2A8]
MTPRMIRQVWTLIDETQPSTLLMLDDNGLVTWLIDEIGTAQSLNRHEARTYSDYIRTRLPLIRDVAAAR